MAGVQPTKFINYISQFKKLLVTRNNGIISQKFKIDSATDDNYYFSIVNSNNRLISLTGRSFKIYGSIFDSKDQMHILFYSDKCTIEQNGQQMHFKIDTYTSQYMNIVKTNKIIDLTIVEVVNPDDEIPDEEQITQVILRDTAIAYKRPYIENQTPAEILEKVILTTNVPLTGVFGSGQDINLTIGSNGAAFGTGLIQTGDNQLVIGKYNEVDNTKAFVIGNGDNETARSNIFAIDYNGNIATSGTLSATGVYVNGKEVGTDTDEKLSATSAWVNDTFETKNAATAVQQELTQEIEDVDSKVNALSTSSNNNFELKTDATSKFNTLSAAIPTNNNQLTNGANYITLAQVPVYTGSGAVVVNQNHVISLTGQLGKTYFADDETLKLNTTTNTFSIKNLSSIVHAGDDGIELVFDAAGNMTIYNTGGGGGGTGAIYRPGEGLSLGENNTFSVDTEWLSGKIDTAISGLENYTAGYGIAIVGDEKAITLTADIPEYVSSLLDASLYAKSADVNNLVVATSAQIIGYVDNKFETQLDSALKYNTLTDQTDYLSGQIDNALSSIDDIGSETNEKIDYVSGFVSGLPSAIDLKAAQTDVEYISSFVSGLPDDIATKANQTDLDYVSGFVSGLPADIATKANQDEFEVISGKAIANETAIGEINTYIETISTTYATKDELSTASGALADDIDSLSTKVGQIEGGLADYATTGQVEQISSFVSGLPTDIATKANQTDLDYVSGFVSGLPDDISAKADQTDLEALSTTVEGLAETKADLSTVQAVDDKFANYYTSTQVDQAIATAVEDIPSTVYTGADGIKVEDGVISLTATLSSITNDAGFITSAEIPTSYVQQSELESVSGQLNNAIGAKANTTDVEAEFTATSAWANETFLSASQIDGYYTKDEVNTITGTLNEAITGKVEQTDFDSLCTVFSGAIDTKQTEEQVSAIVSDIIDVSGLVNSDYIDTVSANIINEIPLSTSQLTNDQFYTSGQVDQALETLSGDLTGWVGKNTLTGYTAGSGIEITEDNVINLTVNTVPSAVSQLVNDSGFITEADIPLSTSDLVNDQFYTSGQVDEMFTATSAWANETFLTEHQSLDNYYNKTQVDTALALKANATDVYTKDQVDTISSNLHNEITDAASGVATEEWVEGHFLSSLTSADIPEEFVTATELATALEPYALTEDVTTAITSATSGKVNKSDFDTVTGALSTAIDGKTTTAAVKDQIEAYGYQNATDVANAISSKADLSAVEAEFTATSAWANATFLTEHQSLDNYYNKTQVDTALALKANATDVYDKTSTYNKEEVNAISTALSSTVSGAGYLTEHQSLDNYYNKTQVDTALALKANATDVYDKTSTYNKEEVNAISTALSSTVSGAGYLTEHQSLADYYTKTEVNTITGTLEGEITGKVAQSDFNSLCTAFSGAIDGKTTTAEVQQQIEDYGYQNAEGVATIVEGYDYATTASVGTAIDELSSTYYNKTEVNTITGNLSTALVAELSGDDDTTYTGSESINITGNDNAISVDNDWLTCKIAEQIPPSSNYTAGFGLSRTDVTGGARFDLTGTVLSAGTGITISSNEISITDASDYVKAGDNVSRLTNDAGYLTAHQSLDAYTPLSTFEDVSGAVVTISGDYVKSNDIADFIDASSASQIASGVVDSYITSGLASREYVTSQINDLSGVISTDYLKKANYHEYTDSDVATYLTTNNYVTSGQISATYAKTTDISTYVAGANVTITPVENENKFTVSATDTTYSAGTGLDLDNNTNTFSVSASWLTGQVASVVDATYVSNLGFVTTSDANTNYAAKSVEGDVTVLKAASGDFSNYYTKEQVVPSTSAAMYEAVSGDVEDQITGKGYQTASDVNTAINAVTGTLSTELTGWVTDQGYVKTDTTYTAGTGLKLTGTEFSLSAAGAGENKVLSSHDGVISWETNVAGGGGGTTYTAGTGIDITNDEISVKLSAATNGNIQVTENNGVIYLSAANSGGGGSGSNNLSDYNNDVPFLEAGDLTNKQRVLSIDGATITYDPNIEIFKTIYYTGGDVTLNAVTVTTSQVANGEVATFEEWITFNSAVTSISEGTNTLIGEWPSTIDYSKTHVLVRRLVNNNGTIVQYVSYAYNF